MKHSHKKSFDWYSMQQRFSIRKYHFGAASVLLGTALVLGSAANAQTVQADENGSENTKTVKADKFDDSAKIAEKQSTNTKSEKSYAAPSVSNPVEVTPTKSEDVKAPAEKLKKLKARKKKYLLIMLLIRQNYQRLFRVQKNWKLNCTLKKV